MECLKQTMDRVQEIGDPSRCVESVRIMDPKLKELTKAIMYHQSLLQSLCFRSLSSPPDTPTKTRWKGILGKRPFVVARYATFAFNQVTPPFKNVARLVVQQLSCEQD